MVELWRDFWIRYTGTGQQVAQLHERYMMIMMMIVIFCNFDIVIFLFSPWKSCPSQDNYKNVRECSTGDTKQCFWKEKTILPLLVIKAWFHILLVSFNNVVSSPNLCSIKWWNDQRVGSYMEWCGHGWIQSTVSALACKNWVELWTILVTNVNHLTAKLNNLWWCGLGGTNSGLVQEGTYTT